LFWARPAQNPSDFRSGAAAAARQPALGQCHGLTEAAARPAAGRGPAGWAGADAATLRIQKQYASDFI
jgi:hypothetical protein